MTTGEFLILSLVGPHSETLPLELRRFVKNLHDHVEQIRLADGCRIDDLSDFREFCRELVVHLEGMKKGVKVA